MKKTKNYLDYVTKDYEGFRNEMLSLIPKYTPEWTDQSQSDFGVVMIELLANTLDILAFNQDKTMKESFISTAETRKAIIEHSKTLGYEIKLQTPSIHKIKITKESSAVNKSITIPKGLKIGTDLDLGGQQVFELLGDSVVMESGISEIELLATHGITENNEFLGTSTGQEFQLFPISYPDVLIDSLIINTIENNRKIKWAKVDDFLKSSEEDRHYTISVNEYNNVKIGFGNGLSGMIPKSGVNIQASYRYGGGEIGNVGIGTINSFVDVEIPGIHFKNTEIYKRGTDVEDIERVRLKAPKHFRSRNTCVTVLDFEDIIGECTGVNKAKCIETFNEDGDLLLYVDTNSHDKLTDGQKDEILKRLKDTMLVNNTPKLLDVNYVDFNIDVEVLTYDTYINKEINTKCKEKLEEIFHTDYMEFGETLYVSSIIGELVKIQGVRNVIVKEPKNDIKVEKERIARLLEVKSTTTGGEDIEV